MKAYRCDECGEFEEGDAHIAVKMTFTGDDVGFLGKLFGMDNGRSTVEFCSLACLESYSFDERRDEMIADYDRKDELLDQPEPEALVETEDGFALDADLVEEDFPPTHRVSSLKDIPGIGGGKAILLRENGYETPADLADATHDELAAIDGIGNSLSRRIQAFLSRPDIDCSDGDTE